MIVTALKCKKNIISPIWRKGVVNIFFIISSLLSIIYKKILYSSLFFSPIKKIFDKKIGSKKVILLKRIWIMISSIILDIKKYTWYIIIHC